MTKPHAKTGVYGCRPIYDWNDGDVWHAIRQQGWEYSTAYDVMNRAGVSRSQMRTAPPSSSYAVNMLPFAAQSWPQWWDKVCRRLPGMQSAAQYGKRVLQP